MGFFEILIIAVVALLVVGPQRMPEAVRTVALTIGRIKRTLNSARTEIEKHVGADDIRRQLHNETIMQNLAKVKDQVDDVNDAFDKADSAYEAQKKMQDDEIAARNAEKAEITEPTTTDSEKSDQPRTNENHS